MAQAIGRRVKLRVSPFAPSGLAMEGAWLVMALRAATAAGQGTKDIRSLRWQAFEVSYNNFVHPEVVRDSQTKGNDAVDDMDAVLALIKSLSGLPGEVTIEAAKTWLRSYGTRGGKAASTLAGLSKSRNTQSHPKARQLMVEIQQLIADEFNVQYATDDKNNITKTARPTIPQMGRCPRTMMTLTTA